MDLILWRHADAEDGAPDLERKLTDKGHKQAKQMAAWLREHMPDGTRVLVSPAARAQQTARALTDKFETVQAIEPGAAPEVVLTAAGWPQARHAALVVGHQPTLGEVAALLISGEPVEWSLKKGAIAWLSGRHRDHSWDVVLRAALSPDLL
jgi:phosphohistidine phosphatase